MKLNSLPSMLIKKESLDTFYYTIGNVFSTFVTFITLPIITRIISPDEFGIFNYTNSIKNFLFIVTSLSLNSFLLRYYFKLKNDEQKKILFGTIFTFLLVFSSVLLAIELFLFPLLIDYFSIQIAFDPFFKIMLINNYLEVAGIIPLVIYRVKKQPINYLFLTLFKSLLSISMGLLLMIFYDKGILGRYLGILYPNIGFLLIYFLVLRNKIAFGINLEILKKGLRYSLPIVPAAFAAVAMSSIDKLMIERYMGVKDISLYAIGFSIGSAILILIRGFYLAIEPFIFENFNKNNFTSLIVRYKAIFIYFVNFLGCFVIIFSKEIISFFVSEAYHNSHVVIPFIVTSCIFRGAQIVVDTTLYALEKTKYHPIIVFSGLFINFLGNLFLVPLIGILGAAISSLIAFWSLYIISIYVTKKFIDVNWMSLKISIYIATSCLISSFISNAYYINAITTIIIKFIYLIILGLVTYAMLKQENNKLIKIL